jgi:hypothetical protein
MKNPFSKKNIWITAPLTLAILLDGVFTLVGQPAEYWQNYVLFNEGSPVGQILMLNPLYFVSFFIIYLILIPLLVANLRRPLNIMIWLGFFLGHVWGASTWVYRIFADLTGIYDISRWYLVVGYIIIISVVAGIFINKAYEKNKL